MSDLTGLWHEAHAACNGNRDAMWDWLEQRLRTVEAERDAYAQELENRQHSAEARVEAADKLIDELHEWARWNASMTILPLIESYRAALAVSGNQPQ